MFKMSSSVINSLELFVFHRELMGRYAVLKGLCHLAHSNFRHSATGSYTATTLPFHRQPWYYDADRVVLFHYPLYLEPGAGRTLALLWPVRFDGLLVLAAE